MCLEQVATTAESLGVCAVVRPAIKDRDDMVKLQMLRGPAIDAMVASPLPTLHRSELLPIASEFWRLLVGVRSVGTTLKHELPRLLPKSLRSFRDTLLRLIGVAISLSVLVPDAFAFAARGDCSASLLGVGASPKRIALTFREFREASPGTRSGLASCDMGRVSVKLSPAVLTGEGLASSEVFGIRHLLCLKSDNGVNSGNNSTIRSWRFGVNPEPSRVGNNSEGATTRGRGYSESHAGNAPTSALPEREEIVWTARRLAEVGSKRPDGNKSVTPQDGLTTAFYKWTEIAASISISRREERQNNGEAAIINLLSSKVQQAEMSLKQAVNTQLVQGTANGSAGAIFVPGNDGKDLNPLGYFAPKNKATAASGTGVGQVGEIARATYSWWRSRSASLTDSGDPSINNDFYANVTTWSALRANLKKLWNYCSRGADGSGPNIILADQATYENYENSLQAQMQYTDTRLGNIGFDNLKLKGGTMVWDELVPDLYTETAAITTGSAFFINTKYYKLCIDSATDFATTDFVTPENQTARVAKVLFMGQATCSNMRKIGSAARITVAITS